MTLSTPWIIAMVATLLLVAGWKHLSKGTLMNTTGMSVTEALAAGATIVDVRTPEEFRTGAYAGATNIPLQSLQGRLTEIPKDRPVVLYCASGGRSGAGASLLKQAGYDQVINAGGLHQMPR